MTVPTRAARLIVLVVVALFGALAAPSVAAASADQSEVRGSLQVGSGADRAGVEGVTVTVSSEGTEIGSAVSDADGAWVVAVPGPATYEVELDETTLPDGVSIRAGRSATVTVTLTAAGTKNALFPLDDGSAPTGGAATASTDDAASASTGDIATDGEAALDEAYDEADDADAAADADEDSNKTNRVLQLIVDGLKLGLIIAMCSVGLSLIYGTTGLVNFAHGEMVTLGAITAYVINVGLGIAGFFGSLIFGAFVAVLVTGVAGGLFNMFVWRPLRRKGASLIAGLVVSIGFSIMFRYIYLWRFGGRAKFYDDYRIQDKVYVGNLFGLAPKEIVVMVVAVFVLLGVAFGLERTRAGKAMRAVADNKDLAESSGINVESVIMGVWIVGSALAGLGGVLFGVSENINWEMGFRTLLLMFAGITLGGLGTAYGALVGSLVIGLLIQLSTLVLPPDLKNVPALLLMVLILLFRPQGIFGRAERIG